MNQTPLQRVFDAFFDLITEDMFVTMTEEEVRSEGRSLLLASLPTFEFPERVIEVVTITDEFGVETDYFNRELTLEEINILATGMLRIWLHQQLNSIELTRQKFTGPDFKLTAQSGQMTALRVQYRQAKEDHRGLQMLASRRRRTGDRYESNFDLFVKRMS